MRKMSKMFLVAMAVVMAIGCTCFAAVPSGDLNGFVEAFESGVNPNTLWGSLIPVVGILVTAYLFAFVWGRIRKATKKTANSGKFGM